MVDSQSTNAHGLQDPLGCSPWSEVNSTPNVRIIYKQAFNLLEVYDNTHYLGHQADWQLPRIDNEALVSSASVLYQSHPSDWNPLGNREAQPLHKQNGSLAYKTTLTKTNTVVNTRWRWALRNFGWIRCQIMSLIVGINQVFPESKSCQTPTFHFSLSRKSAARPYACPKPASIHYQPLHK